MKVPGEPDRGQPEDEREASDPVEVDDLEPGRPGGHDLRSLPIAGITRRHVAWGLAAAVSIWIVIVFARQVADAGSATDRANQLRAQNSAIGAQVSALQQEYALVQRQAFIEQQARAYGLGESSERPFELAPGTSPVPVNAPGSAAVALGARTSPSSALEAWLELLFGPSD